MIRIEARSKPRRGRVPVARRKALGIARALARHIRVRVEVAGRPVDRGGDYHPSYGRILISPRYPVHGGHIAPRSGARVFSSSAALRKTGARFATTGGMWSGMIVLPMGYFGARILFRGRSLGQAISRYTKRGKAKGRKESNALKAWTVFGRNRVNLLKQDASERRAIKEAVEHLTGNLVIRRMHVRITWDVPIGSRVSSLARAMIREAERT